MKTTELLQRWFQTSSIGRRIIAENEKQEISEREDLISELQRLRTEQRELSKSRDARLAEAREAMISAHRNLKEAYDAHNLNYRLVTNEGNVLERKIDILERKLHQTAAPALQEFADEMVSLEHLTRDSWRSSTDQEGFSAAIAAIRGARNNVLDLHLRAMTEDQVDSALTELRITLQRHNIGRARESEIVAPAAGELRARPASNIATRNF